jgi:hypothetical protein
VPNPSEESAFTHLLKDNGTFDSICPRCLATVAHELPRSELDSKEQKHVCNPRTAEHYRELSEAIKKVRDQKKR